MIKDLIYRRIRLFVFIIRAISREEDNKIVVQIKDFPKRKQKLLQKDMKKFANKLYERIDTMYFFEIVDTK